VPGTFAWPEIGVVDYIKKPYDKDDLLRRIGKITGKE